MFKLLIFFFCLSLLLIYPQSSVMADWAVDTTVPTCTISFNPASGQADAGTAITITLTGSDDSGISSLRLIKDGTNLATSTYSPLTYTWTPSTGGSYSFTASAADTAGNVTSSCTVTGLAADGTYTVNTPGPISNVSCNPKDSSGNVLTSSTTNTNIYWTASYSGGNSSNTYGWTGNDSFTSTSNPATKTYSTIGTKSATVTVTSPLDNSSGVATCSVQIYNPLDSSCSASPTPPPDINTSTAVTWSASASGGTGTYEYSWTGTDLSVARNSSSSTVKYYSTAGTKTATVTVYSGDLTSLSRACSNSVVMVTPPPIPYIQTSGGDVHSNTNINTPGGP